MQAEQGGALRDYRGKVVILIQGRIMLGHVQPTTSDIYAVSDPAHLGRALEVTTALIAVIEALAPGAFYRTFTARAIHADKAHSF